MRLVVAISMAALALALPISAQQQAAGKGDLDASPTLFTVMAAANAAGFNLGADSPFVHPIRQAIRDEVLKRNPAVLPKIKDFLSQHRLNTPDAEQSQYIQFALSVEDPPSFAFRLTSNMLGPEVNALDGLAPLLAQFYEQAGIADLWARSQRAIDQALEQYHEPATQVITETAAFLRAPLGMTAGNRRFQVLICLQCAPNHVQFTQLYNETFLVLTPSPDDQRDEIRRAYLFFLLNPLATKALDKLDEKQSLMRFADPAPLLNDQYKRDFALLATASLQRAIEAYLAPSARRLEMVNQAMSYGFILTAAFYEQLPVYAKQEQSMQFYFPEMVSHIDVVREESRLARIEFATKRAEKIVKAPARPEPELSPVEKTLAEAEALFNARNLDAARERFLSAAAETNEKSLQAKAYYGLARVALLKKDLDLALELFQKTLELGPPPTEHAWTLVQLGEMYLIMTDGAEQAKTRFQEALALEGAPEAARQKAQEGLEKAARLTP